MSLLNSASLEHLYAWLEMSISSTKDERERLAEAGASVAEPIFWGLLVSESMTELEMLYTELKGAISEMEYSQRQLTSVEAQVSILNTKVEELEKESVGGKYATNLEYLRETMRLTLLVK